jgi:hypothetical protein
MATIAITITITIATITIPTGTTGMVATGEEASGSL